MFPLHYFTTFDPFAQSPPQHRQQPARVGIRRLCHRLPCCGARFFFWSDWASLSTIALWAAEYKALVIVYQGDR